MPRKKPANRKGTRRACAPVAAWAEHLAEAAAVIEISELQTAIAQTESTHCRKVAVGSPVVMPTPVALPVVSALQTVLAFLRSRPQGVSFAISVSYGVLPSARVEIGLAPKASSIRAAA